MVGSDVNKPYTVRRPPAQHDVRTKTSSGLICELLLCIVLAVIFHDEKCLKTMIQKKIVCFSFRNFPAAFFVKIDIIASNITIFHS